MVRKYCDGYVGAYKPSAPLFESCHDCPQFLVVHLPFLLGGSQLSGEEGDRAEALRLIRLREDGGKRKAQAVNLQNRWFSKIKMQ